MAKQETSFDDSIDFHHIKWMLEIIN